LLRSSRSHQAIRVDKGHSNGTLPLGFPSAS
jgi:hypothetical protein